ncbi:hypothetical protein [Methylocella sp.]|jgi:hypothetical protein|uniref:hypothetical protein n=1 Tax=Methylocella sp. TaxID=1978226 RepID=UPI003C232522
MNHRLLKGAALFTLMLVISAPEAADAFGGFRGGGSRGDFGGGGFDAGAGAEGGHAGAAGGGDSGAWHMRAAARKALLAALRAAHGVLAQGAAEGGGGCRG